MYKKEDLSFEEFTKTAFHTRLYVRIPLLDISLEKTNYFTRGKLDLNKLNSAIRDIYDENFK